MSDRFVEVTAPSNIAIIKYWGKRCVDLNLPLNSSLSATLCQDHLKSTTKISTSPRLTDDELLLNGCKQSIPQNSRIQKCLSQIRSAARMQGIRQGNSSLDDIKVASQKMKISSTNNFPTAAGLASSASGYAALVFGMGKLLSVKGDLTPIARQGSGSACRSLHGGFVKWQMGKEEDGSDSTGYQIAPETHWEELRIFVIVVNDMRKKVGSTAGMQLTVETSTLLKHRVEHVVEDRMKTACDAIKNKDFPTLADVIMRESNQLHAVCLDTNPPLRYLNDVSFMIMDMVHSYNTAVGSLQAAYTFDAGPNACLFTTKSRANEIAWLIRNLFPTDSSDSDFFRGMSVTMSAPKTSVMQMIDLNAYSSNMIKYVICTKVGDGPRLVPCNDTRLVSCNDTQGDAAD